MAQCVDLRRERIVAADRFLLDTNVIMAVSSLYSSVRTQSYLTFLEKTQRVGASVTVSILSLLELGHVVERLRFRELGGTLGDSAELKRFRSDRPQRERVAQDVAVTWNEIAGFATVLAIDLPTTFAPELLGQLASTTLDTYDYAFIDQARRAEISTIVSDDGDFKSATGIIIFTANAKVLA